jgi:type II secretory pathway component PulF
MNSSAKSGVLVTTAGVIIHALLWLALAFGMVFLMPTIKKEFVEYQMKLPAIAEYTVLASDWFNNYWYVLVITFIPVCALDAAVLFVTWRIPWARGLSICWFLAMAAAPLLLMALAAWSVWVAHAKLVEGLSR